MACRMRRTGLTAPQIAQLLGLADPLTHDQAFLSLCCGATVAELESITWKDIDFRSQTLWLDGALHPSQPKARLVKLPSVLASKLWNRKLSDWESGSHDSIWFNIGGLHCVPLETRWGSLFLRWEAAYREKTVNAPPPFPLPDWQKLREFTISMLLNQGISEQQVADWAGVALDGLTPEADDECL